MKDSVVVEVIGDCDCCSASSKQAQIFLVVEGTETLTQGETLCRQCWQHKCVPKRSLCMAERNFFEMTWQ